MKLLKNTRFAAGVLAVVLLTSLYVGTNRSLTKLSRDVEKTFYDSGKADATDTIDAQLGACADAVMGVITVASRYSELESATEQLRVARMQLISATTIVEKEIAFLEMNSTYEALSMQIEPITGDDLKNWNAYSDTYSSVKTMLLRLTAEYYDRVYSFPENLLNIKPQRFGIDKAFT